jgi:RNA polymerase sigma factor (sigma-70 family)
MASPQIDEALAGRLFRRAGAERWQVPPRRFKDALEASVTKILAGRSAGAGDIERMLESLHLEDLALACACEAGHEGAWEHFVREHRPVLYRSADAIDPGGGARELADSLYADLFGMTEREGARQSLFRYFHGRSSLATWLRAVLAQRHVDRIRAARRLEPLPEEESRAALAAPIDSFDPGRSHRASAVDDALAWAIARASDRDRLRLRCYYAQEMTLAEIGRLLHEHEATASRQLARTRRALGDSMVTYLREQAGMNDSQISECFETVMDDAGTIDLKELLTVPAGRKNPLADRSSIKRSE